MSTTFYKFHKVGFKMFLSKLIKPFKYTLRGIIVSDIGRKRLENQDNFSFGEFINTNKASSVILETRCDTIPQAYAIMDGMGGEKLGAQASLEVACFFSEIKLKLLEVLPKLSDNERKRVFTSLIYSLNEKVCQMAFENNVAQSGTTIVAAFFSSGKVHFLSIGDSQIFLIRDGKAILQNELDVINIRIMDNGIEKPIKGGLSQFLGMDTTEYDLVPHIIDLKLRDQDIILLCSDGLTDYVSSYEIGEIVSENSIKDSVNMLLSLALKRGGRDNITILCLVVDVDR